MAKSTRKYVRRGVTTQSTLGVEPSTSQAPATACDRELPPCSALSAVHGWWSGHVPGVVQGRSPLVPTQVQVYVVKFQAYVSHLGLFGFVTLARCYHPKPGRTYLADSAYISVPECLPCWVWLMVSGPQIALSSQGYINGIVQGQNTPLHDSMGLALCTMCIEDSTWCGCKHVFGCFATCKTFCTAFNCPMPRIPPLLLDEAMRRAANIDLGSSDICGESL